MYHILEARIRTALAAHIRQHYSLDVPIVTERPPRIDDTGLARSPPERPPGPALAQVRKKSAGSGPHQSLFSFPAASAIQGGEKIHLPSRERGDRQAVTIDQAIVRQRGQSRAGRESADQVQRVGARQRNPLVRERPAARFQRQAERSRQRICIAQT